MPPATNAPTSTRVTAPPALIPAVFHCHPYHAPSTIKAAAVKRAPMAQPQLSSLTLKRAPDAGRRGVRAACLRTLEGPLIGPDPTGSELHQDEGY